MRTILVRLMFGMYTFCPAISSSLMISSMHGLQTIEICAKLITH
jgi:hypothetical protein